MHRIHGFVRAARWSLCLLACGLADDKGVLAQTTCKVAHLSASDGGAFDSLGRATAVSGETALAGAYADDDNGLDSGSAYIFARKGTAWAQTQKLLASDGQAGDWFGHSVAIDGNTAMVGALQVGSVYVFRFNGTSWIQQQVLTASDGQLSDAFSASIAISGDVAIIGAYADSDNGDSAGSAYIFRFDPGSQQWLQEQKLLAPEGAEGIYFGREVSVSGNAAIVGAPAYNDLHGAAYVFRYDGAAWVHEQEVVSADGVFNAFGWSVSISGNVALIGAFLDDTAPGSLDAGSAYVFQFDEASATWVQVQKLLASDGSDQDQFGRSVAIGNEVAIVGSFGSNAAGVDMGAAYVFRANGGVWSEEEQLLPDPNPWTAFFGWSVGLSGDTAVVGAYGESVQHGAVYVYAGMSGTDCNATGRADACDLFLGLSKDADNNGIPDECQCPWDLDGSGAVAVNDFLDLLAAWGSNPGGPPDFDGDGDVGILDFLTLLVNWGPCA